MKFLTNKHIPASEGEGGGEDSGNSSSLPHLVYSPVLKMHKAWRHYKGYKLSNSNNNTSTTLDISTTPFNNTTLLVNTSDVSAPFNTTTAWHSRLDNHRFHNNNHNTSQDITNNNINFHSTDDVTNFDNTNFKVAYPLIESDPNSISSDHSELNDSLRGQLAFLDLTSHPFHHSSHPFHHPADPIQHSSDPIHLISEPLDHPSDPFSHSNKQHNDHYNSTFTGLSNNTTPHNTFPSTTPSSHDVTKESRKNSILNIAHEFACLKKTNCHALPFNLHNSLHHSLRRGHRSESTSDTDEIMIPCDHSHPPLHLPLPSHPPLPPFSSHHQQSSTNDINNNNNNDDDDFNSNPASKPPHESVPLAPKDHHHPDTLPACSAGTQASGLRRGGSKVDASDGVENNYDDNGDGDGADGGADGGADERPLNVCSYENNCEDDNATDIRGCADGGCDEDDECGANEDEDEGDGGGANEDEDEGGGGGANKDDGDGGEAGSMRSVNGGAHNNNVGGDNNKDKELVANGNKSTFSVITISNNDTSPSINLRNKPGMNRSTSNKQLRGGEEEKKKIWQHRLSTREEILKKLALQGDEEEEDEDETPHPSSGLFYVNEAAPDIEKDGGGGGGGASDTSTSGSKRKHHMCKAVVKGGDVIGQDKVGGVTYLAQSVIMENKATPDIIASTNDVSSEDFIGKQERLQKEAKMALAQARPMAYMQLQLEKKKKVNKCALSEISGMSEWVGGSLRGGLSQYSRDHMNVAQLQVLVNDMHARIEVLNSDLMEELVRRDELHTVQDSMLVDIEDLTGRAQEFASRQATKEAAKLF